MKSLQSFFSSVRKWSALSGRGRGVLYSLCGYNQGTLSVDRSFCEAPRVKFTADPFRKRKVALWIGYVGTALNGLQIVRDPHSVNTIEYELERAIYRAGGILHSNYGQLNKISWSRSNRTDKGVHSLSTVITMKMEVPSSAWLGDQDGLLLADGINMHLPPTIQIFGVVPVTKTFEARRFCCNRTYHYLLPASLIGITRESSPDIVGQVIEKFRSVLTMFEGRAPFHNYTIRRVCRTDGKRKTPPPVQPLEEEWDDYTDVPDLPLAAPVSSTCDSTRDCRLAYWLDAPDLSDKLSISHFRRILEFSCGALESYDGSQFVRISIIGESFMVHQIRKMVATAVAVSRGFLPRDIISLSLSRHARFVLPLAPPHGLLLAKNSFHPFGQLHAPIREREFRESKLGVSRLAELPKLQISRQMLHKMDIFWNDVLLPQIAHELDESLPIWNALLGSLSRNTLPDAELQEVRAGYINWKSDSQLKMEQLDKGRSLIA